jgi:hypothetical protein
MNIILIYTINFIISTKEREKNVLCIISSLNEENIQILM